MENNKVKREEMLIKDVIFEDGTIANIIATEFSIYVMSNKDIEDQLLQNEIAEITKEMFEDGKDIVNVIYSENYGVYQVLKKGTDADDMLSNIECEDVQEFIENEANEPTIEEIMG